MPVVWRPSPLNMILGWNEFLIEYTITLEQQLYLSSFSCCCLTGKMPGRWRRHGQYYMQQLMVFAKGIEGAEA